jgi:hypothetical protein
MGLLLEAFGQVGQGQILALARLHGGQHRVGVGEIHGLGQLHAQMLFQTVDEAVQPVHEGVYAGLIPYFLV